MIDWTNWDDKKKLYFLLGEVKKYEQEVYVGLISLTNSFFFFFFVFLNQGNYINQVEREQNESIGYSTKKRKLYPTMK